MTWASQVCFSRYCTRLAVAYMWANFISVSSTHTNSFHPMCRSTVVSIVFGRCTYCRRNQFMGKLLDIIHDIVLWHFAGSPNVLVMTLNCTPSEIISNRVCGISIGIADIIISKYVKQLLRIWSVLMWTVLHCYRVMYTLIRLQTEYNRIQIVKNEQ